MDGQADKATFRGTSYRSAQKVTIFSWYASSWLLTIRFLKDNQIYWTKFWKPNEINSTQQNVGNEKNQIYQTESFQSNLQNKIHQTNSTKANLEKPNLRKNKEKSNPCLSWAWPSSAKKKFRPKIFFEPNFFWVQNFSYPIISCAKLV